ncbi:hypothetical protein F511_12258 [Dorcoceras hygrometricum]|uniref:Uncharacterized protein n=1 Tax=Dorcoceras hygrometricum TaxID=472368 RepID=A0A2Z7A435_9LAMI|nr:hypothetical protein F511_12258 [Dorcoceras hygrometricum]
MATAPSKSQPLHNFSLSQLKWAQKTSSSYRRRDSPDQCPAVSKASPPNDAGEQNGEEDKPWSLRLRKGAVKAVPFQKKEICVGAFGDTGDRRIDGAGNRVNLQRVRGLVDGGQQGGLGMERKEKKMKLWISLSREEIEEDVYALTGSRPARRPRKWPKNVQKQLDNLFPGLYLVGLAADSYRIPDAPVGSHRCHFFCFLFLFYVGMTCFLRMPEHLFSSKFVVNLD